MPDEMDETIVRVSGRMVPLRGNDIDTDRIVPARYLRCVTFGGLGEHAFEDDRRQLAATGKTHPFDDERFQGGRILLVNRNFGCGSSREHAPQALRGWGICAVVGESFAEIFFGNCTTLGIPCVTAAADALARLMDLAEREPETSCVVDVEAGTVAAGDSTFPATLPPGPRQAFLDGTWDALSLLRADFAEVGAVAARLPYVSGDWPDA